MRTVLTGLTVFALLSGALLAQIPNMGQMFGPETDPWMNFVPTLDLLGKTQAASDNLHKVTADNPEIRESTQVDLGMGGRRGGGPPQQVKIPTIDEMVAALEKHPEAKAAVESAGISTEDYFKTMLSTMFGWSMYQMDQQGALAQIQKMMPQFRVPASLDFIRANPAETKEFVDAVRKMGD